METSIGRVGKEHQYDSSVEVEMLLGSGGSLTSVVCALARQGGRAAPAGLQMPGGSRSLRSQLLSARAGACWLPFGEGLCSRLHPDRWCNS